MTLRNEDWTMLVIGAAKGEAVSPVQLQKALFLLGANVPELKSSTEFYRFEPYDYGPFCADVYQDAERLSLMGLVRLARDQSKPYREYFATPTGITKATELQGQVEGMVFSYLEDVVAWVRSLSFVDLVRAIYKEHPDMRSRSVFKDPT